MCLYMYIICPESVGEDKNGEQPCASALVKQFNVSNVAQLDKRIQEELEQLGMVSQLWYRNFISQLSVIILLEKSNVCS